MGLTIAQRITNKLNGFIWNNIWYGKVKQGASTLTQQLVRQLVLNSDRTLKRKIIEAISAVRLELTLSKLTK